MKSAAQFVDDIRKKLNLPSDNRVATALGVTRATVSRWRNGEDTLNEENALKIAELLGEDPRFVLLCSLAHKAQHEKARKLLTKIADGFSGKAATFIAAIATAGMPFAQQSNQQHISELSSENLYIYVSNK